MLNILIADDNIHYVKSLVNFVIGRNSSIKIVNIASNGLEVLDVLQKNKNIDLILLDLKMPKLNGIETLNKIQNMHLLNHPSIIVISGENRFIDKIINHPLVTGIINKSDNMIDIYHKLKDIEKELDFQYIKEDLARKINVELIHIGYNPSHIGTLYMRECILEIYENKNLELIRNLENYVYKKIACMHNKSLQNVKSNINKATDFMYAEANMNFLQNYFNFNDNKKKPTPKMVISTILNKL